MNETVLAARAVLFDWDGTLLDSFDADSRAYLAMFAALGIEWTLRDLAQNYHPDWYQVYRSAKIVRPRWKEADRLWREAYGRENPKLMLGARGVLRALGKRFALGLVTSGDRSRVREQLQKLRLASRFSVCVCSEDASHKKPHPAPLRRALECLGVAPEESVYVGDSPQDMEMAQRAGVRAVGIFGPFPTEQGLRAARPALLLNSVRELPGHLLRMPEAKGRKSSTTAALVVKAQAARQKKRALRNRSDA